MKSCELRESHPKPSRLREREARIVIFTDNSTIIEQGKYLALNVTVINGCSYHSSGSLLALSLPNGIYRHTIKLSNDEDPIGFMMYWHMQRYDAMGEDRI